MNHKTIVDPPGDDAVAHEALIDECLNGMKQLQQQMAVDRQEILALQAETRFILANVMIMLKAA